MLPSEPGTTIMPEAASAPLHLDQPSEAGLLALHKRYEREVHEALARLPHVWLARLDLDDVQQHLRLIVYGELLAFGVAPAAALWLADDIVVMLAESFEQMFGPPVVGHA
jgi:hypothetical protein